MAKLTRKPNTAHTRSITYNGRRINGVWVTRDRMTTGQKRAHTMALKRYEAAWRRNVEAA